MTKALLPLLFLLSACGGTQPAVDPTPDAPGFAVHFTDAPDLEAVIAEAKAANKPIFIDVHAVWCYPCKRMDAEVYNDPQIGLHMNQNFINYRVDAERTPGDFVADKYQVRIFPTLLFLDQHGHVLVKHEGGAFDQELIRLAEEAMGEYKREAD